MYVYCLFRGMADENVTTHDLGHRTDGAHYHRLLSTERTLEYDPEPREFLTR